MDTEAPLRGKHATAEFRAIAEQGTILRCQVGSGVHGTSVAGTDNRDEMGICTEPPEYVIGLRRFEQYEHHTAWERDGGLRNRSGPGDLDITVYSLRKWLRLALAGNPSVLVPLFVPAAEIVAETPLGAELREMAPRIVSRQAGERFAGYLHAQRRGLLSHDGKGRDVTRPELIEKYGWDTKYGGHMIRLAAPGPSRLRRDGRVAHQCLRAGMGGQSVSAVWFTSDTPGDACVIPGCDKPPGRYRKVCQSHRRKMRRYGTYDGKPAQTVEERFWSKVDRRSAAECWPWLASHGQHGYGWFRLEGKMTRAHRVAWMLHHGRSPHGRVIRHTCDNPPCCNPAHLRSGSQAENVADIDERGRRRPARGESVHSTRLTEGAVREIRELFSGPDHPSRAEAARRYGVSGCTIRDVVNRRTWRYLP
jgi:hypothetical protein